jgi:hypothetical protein
MTLLIIKYHPGFKHRTDQIKEQAKVADTETAIDFDQLVHAKPGDTLTLRFRDEAVRDLYTLEMLNNKNIIEVSIADRRTIQAICASGEWGTNPTNRTYSVIVGLDWREASFRPYFSQRTLEFLELIPS